MESCRPLLAAVWWNTTNRYRNSASQRTTEWHVACLYDVILDSMSMALLRDSALGEEVT